jgi:hypothetical protein
MVLTAALAASATGCGGGGGGIGGKTAPGNTPWATVTIETLNGSPYCTNVNAGFTIPKQEAEVQTVNMLKAPVVVTWANGSSVAGVQHVAAQATVNTVFDFDTPGSYVPICTINGHSTQSQGSGLQVKS